MVSLASLVFLFSFLINSELFCFPFQSLLIFVLLLLVLWLFFLHDSAKNCSLRFAYYMFALLPHRLFFATLSFFLLFNKMVTSTQLPLVQSPIATLIPTVSTYICDSQACWYRVLDLAFPNESSSWRSWPLGFCGWFKDMSCTFWSRFRSWRCWDWCLSSLADARSCLAAAAYCNSLFHCNSAIWVLWMFFWLGMSIVHPLSDFNNWRIPIVKDSSFLFTFACYKINFMFLNTSPLIKYWWFICYLLC